MNKDICLDCKEPILEEHSFYKIDEGDFYCEDCYVAYLSENLHIKLNFMNTTIEKTDYTCAICKKSFFARRKAARNKAFYCSRQCADAGNAKVKDKPTFDALQAFLTKGYSYVAIGKLYGVSDNAVKKWMIKAGLHKPTQQSSVDVICAYCKKPVVKQFNRLKNDDGSIKKNLFCSRECSDAYQKSHGKLAGVSREDVLKLRETMSLRAVARLLGVSHSTLQQKFKL